MERVLQIDSLAWESPPGFDAGISQVVLADTLDQVAKRGTRTRLVRFGPGARTTVPFVHDYEEEVYVLEGDQALLDAAATDIQAVYRGGMYFLRPAGTFHGPFSSEQGCLLYELHYYRSAA